jgi:hypothetical protein
LTQAERERGVLEAVVPLVDSLLDDFDVVELLTQLTERCSELLNVPSSGLLLANARGELHLLAATTTRTHDLELFQLQRDEGPCIDSYSSGHPVNVPDLRTQIVRWPNFVPAATAAGFAAVHAMPMRAAGEVIGAMGLFTTTIGELAPADLLVAQTLAHIATVAILQDHALGPDTVKPRLQSALNNRVVVEQATGFLRERLQVSLQDSFRLLRRYAQSTGEHLTDVARILVTEPEAQAQLLAGIRALVEN